MSVQSRGQTGGRAQGFFATTEPYKGLFQIKVPLNNN